MDVEKLKSELKEHIMGLLRDYLLESRLELLNQLHSRLDEALLIQSKLFGTSFIECLKMYGISYRAFSERDYVTIQESLGSLDWREEKQ